MYPYLRLIYVGLKTLLNKDSISIDSELISQFRVYPIDIDTNLHLNNGRYLTMMDLARFEFMGKMGLLKPAFKNRWFPVLGNANMTFLKPLHCFHSYTIHTALECWDEKWFVMTQRFESNNKICAHGLVRGLLRNRKRTIPTSEVLEAADFKNLTSPEPSQTTRLWLETLASYKQGKHNK